MIKIKFTQLSFILLALLSLNSTLFSETKSDSDKKETLWEDDLDLDEDFDDFDDDDEPIFRVSDPLMPFNRAMFKVNDRLYYWILRPVSKGYRQVAPRFFRSGVRNFFFNLGAPIRLVNCGLQAKFKPAGRVLSRFLINSTIGVAGVWDPAKKIFKIRDKDEDFSQTLGKWGVRPGPYIHWPILGPSSLRMTFSQFFDGTISLRNHILYEELWVNLSVSTLEKVNEASEHVEDYDDLKRNSIDPYTFFRDAYYQLRLKKVEE